MVVCILVDSPAPAAEGLCRLTARAMRACFYTCNIPE